MRVWFFLFGVGSPAWRDVLFLGIPEKNQPKRGTWTLKLPIKNGYHPITLGVKPIFKGILRVQVPPKKDMQKYTPYEPSEAGYAGSSSTEVTMGEPLFFLLFQ